MRKLTTILLGIVLCGLLYLFVVWVFWLPH